MSGCGTSLGSGALGDRGVRLALRRPQANPAPAERSGLMLAIHPNARTTPVVRAEIARSSERSGVLAARYGVSTETVRKWRKRGPTECRDRSSRPRTLPWKASEEERAVVCALRRATGFLHLDVKHLPKLRTADGEPRKRYLFVAIDRRSRFVHLAVKDDETEASARSFLEAALAA